MRSSYFRSLLLFCFCLLAGCGGGSGGGSTPNVTVTVSPATIQLQPNQGTDFTATVTGSSNTGVNWSVQEGASGGTVTSAGRYVAPALAGTYHVVATSKANSSKRGQATVTVPLALVVSETAITLTLRESKQFTATLSGASNPAVAWSVQEGDSGGTISQFGLYTAPNVPGTYHVVVVSQATPQQTATITITVVAGGASGTID